MWIGVTKRFSSFLLALQLTQDERDDGWRKQLGVRQSLQRAYWGPTTDDPPGFLVGSWGKTTAIRPPNDIDLFMPLPLEVYDRFNGNAGNVQSALLQEVKNNLLTTYPQTVMRGDGQVVEVAFNTVKVEVVPVFRFDHSGGWIMPDTNGGGRWKTVYPHSEVEMLDRAEAAANHNVRPLIHIMKAWRNHCSVPLKSFALESLIAEFLSSYAFRQYDLYWYDWYVRDFLAYLISRQNGYFFAASSRDTIALGNAWLSKAQTAYNNALEACDDERNDYVYSAGVAWQKIFGDRIPVVV